MNLLHEVGTLRYSVNVMGHPVLKLCLLMKCTSVLWHVIKRGSDKLEIAARKENSAKKQRK